jgi:hypothetical protein
MRRLNRGLRAINHQFQPVLYHLLLGVLATYPELE